jgi:CRP-like cAMP-binding protein
MQAGDISEDLMMVDEGEVTAEKLQQRGYVFNQNGFKYKEPAAVSVVTKTFVSVWAVSLKDLEDLGRTSSRIKDIVAQASA